MNDIDDDDHDTEETEEDRENVAWFGRAVVIPLRRSVVRSLLAGNDTQCFTTEQYKAAYQKQTDEISQTPHEVWWGRPEEDRARQHLLSTGLVRELTPNIWVPINAVVDPVSTVLEDC